MFESAAADRTYFARHDSALEPLVSAQGGRGLICFSAPVALVFNTAGVLLSRSPGCLVCLIESLLIPGQLAVVMRY